MAGGKRFKFQGSTFGVLTSFSGSTAITAITAANPAVVSATAHGLVDGDVVMLDGIVGMTELNDGVYIVNVLTSGTFELVDTDSSGYSAYVSGGTIAKATFSNFCELTGYNRQGAASPEIPATSACSTSQEFEVGLADFGSTQIDFNFAPRTAIQTAIAAYYSGANAGQTFATKVTLPNSGGVMVQLGFIQNTSEQAAVNGLWTGSLTLRNTGRRYDVAAA